MKYDGLEKLGSEGHGWVVPSDRIRSGWICYCVGVGEDASFDLELLKRFSCEVHSFDPTPRAIAYVEQLGFAGSMIRFHPHGLWSADATVKFFAPRDSSHVSHSVVNAQHSTQSFEGPCRRLSSIMSELGHEHIHLLKMDIEGAEYEVLEDMMQQGISPKVLCVEFDQPFPVRRHIRMLHRLTASGYCLVAVDRWNYTFIHRSLVE